MVAGFGKITKGQPGGKRCSQKAFHRAMENTGNKKRGIITIH